MTERPTPERIKEIRDALMDRERPDWDSADYAIEDLLAEIDYLHTSDRLAIPKSILGQPDGDLIRDGRVVGAMWINEKAMHMHPDHIDERTRGEVCTCLDCKLGIPPEGEEETNAEG